MPTDRGLSSADAETLALAEDLRRAVGQFVRSVRNRTETPSSAQSETLGLLEREGPMTVAALAGLRNVRHQSMRLVTAQLETEGLVARLPDPDDGRGNLVFLTEKGKTELNLSRQARAGWIARALEKTSSDEERRALRKAITVLERVAALD